MIEWKEDRGEIVIEQVQLTDIEDSAYVGPHKQSSASKWAITCGVARKHTRKGKFTSTLTYSPLA